MNQKLIGLKINTILGEHICSSCGALFICRIKDAKSGNTKNCLKCRHNVKHTLEWFLDFAQQVHGNRYDYSKYEYHGVHKASQIICKDHGVFYQDANSHCKRGRGCPTCANMSRGGAKTKYNFIDIGNIYLIKLPDFNLWKIGITKYAPKDRIRDTKSIVINSYKLPNMAIAYAVEQYLLKYKYNEYRYTGTKVIESGNTELLTQCPNNFYDDVLSTINLVQDSVNKLKELL